MMPLRRAFIVASAFAALTACAQGQPRGADVAPSAQAALTAAIKAYEAGDAERVIGQFDRGMVGHGQYAESVRRDAVNLRQVRVQLLDTHIAAGADIVYVSSAWEKRFLAARDFKPQLHKGRTTFAMKQSDGGWRISGIAGDNLFSTPVESAP